MFPMNVMRARLRGGGYSIVVVGLGGVGFRVVGRIPWREVGSVLGLRLQVLVHESSVVNNVVEGY